MNFCVLNTDYCPSCRTKKSIFDGICSTCGASVRLIKQTKNEDYRRQIMSYDINGTPISEFSSVYDAYPQDNAYGKEMRQGVINACRGKALQFDNKQWKFSGDKRSILPIVHGKSAKGVVQCDFSGNILVEYHSIGEASKTLSLSAATIKKSCVQRIPPQNTCYFLFFKNEFCPNTFPAAYNRFLNSQLVISVYNPDHELIATYNTYSEASKKLNVSPTSIKNWCSRRFSPSGKYLNYTFEANTLCKEHESVKFDCKFPESISCMTAERNKELHNELLSLHKEIEEMKFQMDRDKFTISAQSLKIQELETHFPFPDPIFDSEISFMTPIDKFLEEKQSTIIGPAIYILCDKDGKRYVGQTQRSVYSRIREHFSDSCNDGVHQAFISGMSFFVERIIVGWKNHLRFIQLDDVEKYYISYYNSSNENLGYNKNGGNAQTISFLHDSI